MKSKVRWKGSLYDLFSVVGEIELISKWYTMAYISQARPNYTGINQDEVLVPSSNSIDVSFLLDQLR